MIAGCKKSIGVSDELYETHHTRKQAFPVSGCKPPHFDLPMKEAACVSVESTRVELSTLWQLVQLSLFAQNASLEVPL